MDEVIGLLTSSSETVVGVIAGALIALIGVLVSTWATRRASREAAETQLEAARLQWKASMAERRLRLAEMMLERRLLHVERLRKLLEEQEVETHDQWVSSWDEKLVESHRREALAVVAGMKPLFPRSVTEAATSTVEASLAHAYAHLSIPRSKDADRAILEQREGHRIKTEREYQGVRTSYQNAVQAEMQGTADDEA